MTLAAWGERGASQHAIVKYYVGRTLIAAPYEGAGAISPNPPFPDGPSGARG